MAWLPQEKLRTYKKHAAERVCELEKKARRLEEKVSRCIWMKPSYQAILGTWTQDWVRKGGSNNQVKEVFP